MLDEPPVLDSRQTRVEPALRLFPLGDVDVLIEQVLAKLIPGYTTLGKAAARLIYGGVFSDQLLDEMVDCPLRIPPAPIAACYTR